MVHPSLRRRALLSAPLLAMAPAPASQAAPAQVRLLIGYPPGGAIDLVARLLAPELAAALGRPVLVEGRIGAGGRLALEALKHATPDGSVLALTPGNVLTLAPHAEPETTRYDPLADFAPVTGVCLVGFALAQRRGGPDGDGPETLAGWLAWCREHPDQAFVGTSSPGTAAYQRVLDLARLSGVPLRPVPYTGGSNAIPDLLAGRIAGTLTMLPELAPLHRDGALHVAATTMRSRLPSLPEVPGFAEQGFPKLAAEEWYGIMAPDGTPDIRGLYAAIAPALASPGLIAAMQQQDLRPHILCPTDLGERLACDHATWGRILERPLP